MLDLDSTGEIDPWTASALIEGDIPELIVENVHAQFLVSQISGNINAASGQATVRLRGALRFTGPGISGSCITPVFTAETKTWSGGTGFTLAADMIIPAINGGTCSRTVDLNSGLGLGSGNARVWLYKMEVDPEIRGS